MRQLNVAAASGPPGKRRDHAGKLEPGQLGQDGVRRQAGARDQRVDVGRVVRHRSQQRDSPTWAPTARIAMGRRRVAIPSSSSTCCGGFHELGALADQLVAALRQRRMDRAGDREDLAALLARVAGGDERPRLQRRLDHQDAARKPADQPVAPRKVHRARRRARARTRRGAPPRSAIACASVAVARRVHAVEARADHRQRGRPRLRARLRARPRRRRPPARRRW